MIKTKNICNLVTNFYSQYVKFLESYAASILLLTIRIWIGLIFLKSGLTKFSNIDSAISLFEYEYQLPLLSPQFAAISAMIFEIGCSTIIMAGFLSRIAALPLIVMTIIIQTLVFQNQEHFYWLFLLSILAIYGSGKISLENLYLKFRS